MLLPESFMAIRMGKRLIERQATKYGRPEVLTVRTLI